MNYSVNSQCMAFPPFNVDVQDFAGASSTFNEVTGTSNCEAQICHYADSPTHIPIIKPVNSKVTKAIQLHGGNGLSVRRAYKDGNVYFTPDFLDGLVRNNPKRLTELLKKHPHLKDVLREIY